MVSLFFLASAFVVGALPPNILGSEIQFVASCILWMTAILLKNKKISFGLWQIAPLLAIPLGVSLGSLSLNLNIEDSLAYSGLLVLKFIIFCNLTLSFSLAELCYSLMIGIILAALYAYVLNPVSLNLAPSVFSELEALERASLYGYHPNLIGANLGFVLVLLTHELLACIAALVKKTDYTILRLAKALSLFTVITCSLGVLLMTSSRAAILGYLIASAFIVLQFIRSAPRFYGNILTLAIGIFGVVYFSALTELFSAIFKLNDLYRGLNSGFTGRQFTWEKLANSLSMLGHGYPPPPLVDNSWISICYQAGYLFSIPILVAILVNTSRIFRRYCLSSCLVDNALHLSLIIYSLIVSLFNQQLFTLTAPLSYVLLISFFFGQGSQTKAAYLREPRQFI
jgi:hypothetical protein